MEAGCSARYRRARSSKGSCAVTSRRSNLGVVRAELEEIADVWRRAPVSAISPREILLVTDFDGTLADIGPDPSQTVAVPDALDALRRLSLALKQVVVLSSRTSAELPRLVPVRSVRLIGASALPPLTPHENRPLTPSNPAA